MMKYEVWTEKLLSVVREMADREFQERVWLRGAGPEVSSWEEMICNFFDDYDADNFIDNHMNKAGLSQEQQTALRKLRNALRSYSDQLGESCSPERIITDPSWHLIRDDLAKKTLEAFKKHS